MTFSRKALRDLTASDIDGLRDVSEGLTIEFKRQLDLDTKKDKREVCKDVAAMANQAGGRIVYGIAEIERADGSRVAESVLPLSDGGIEARLANVLTSGLHPRAQLNTRSVPFGDGFVLVVEIQSSQGLDLHMVTDADGGRFYRRGTMGNIPMSEPEVREAYVHIADRRAAFEERIRSVIGPELGRRQGPGTSFLIVPLFSHPNLVDPRTFDEIGTHLDKMALRQFDLRHLAGRLEIRHDGYRAEEPTPAGIVREYLSVLKSGVVHYSRASPISSERIQTFHVDRAAEEITEAMILANQVFADAGYSGDVRLLYLIRAQAKWTLYPEGQGRPYITTGDYWSEVGAVNLAETAGNWGPLVKELLDPFFHATGLRECPRISSEGVVHSLWSRLFDQPFDAYLKVDRSKD